MPLDTAWVRSSHVLLGHCPAQPIDESIEWRLDHFSGGEHYQIPAWRRSGCGQRLAQATSRPIADNGAPNRPAGDYADRRRPGAARGGYDREASNCCPIPISESPLETTPAA
jgi:hypothetical protein